MNKQLKLLLILTSFTLFVSCDRNAIEMALEQVQQEQNVYTCSLPADEGTTVVRGTVGTCRPYMYTPPGSRMPAAPVMDYTPDNGNFSGTDTCRVGASVVTLDYSNPSRPSCTVANCRLIRGAPCI